ncbi:MULTISPECIES: Clp protease N-terminal domain-containing protein [Streptomyces]|uniref:Clp protease N-terminal domain-containing protein n=1 Tax=Streptomyces chilikensis TaxID=1194079 RepID=A0ABV3EMR4_9ACTN|nr:MULTISPECIES: Clp protease N-terminal domain-containing protein [Streptomyces]MDH6225022.1 ATP-dependent Clp protease ATP-binding subunit ClpA [Streptomyces sp. MJP52]
MFERFTKDARDVVTGAVEHAERSGAERVDEGHLLLSLLDRTGSRGSFALAALGLAERREAVAGSLAAARRRGGLTGADAEALSGLGIDLDEIVSRVEAVHGAGALARRGGGTRRRSGHRPFTRGAKGILEESLRGALAHRERRIGDEHLLLALACRPGIASGVLAEHGVTAESLERVLWGGGEAAAS